MTHTVTTKSPSTILPQPSRSPGILPQTQIVNCANLSPRFTDFRAAISIDREPTSFSKAVQHESWREAMKREIQALENNDTWIITTLPPGKTALGCKWVYKIKYKHNGSVERPKAHPVILKYHQVERINYTETFAPVAKMVTVRTLLAVAAGKGWDLHQMDVHNTFLHGDLQNEVYMKLPLGFKGPRRIICVEYANHYMG